MSVLIKVRLMHFWLYPLRLVLIFVLMVSSVAQGQEVLIVPVRSYGQGATEASAVKDAIVQAIGQVTGEWVKASTSISLRDSESSTGKGEHSATIDSKIDSLIRGVVKSSQTVSVDKDPSTGLFKSIVDAKIASYKQSAQLKRVKLAIVLSAQALPKELAGNGIEFAQALQNGVSDQLVSSRKFAVLDRKELNSVQSEFNQIRSGKTGVEEMVRLQSAAVADFLVILSVENFGTSQSALGSIRARSTGRAIVLDYASGQIRQSVSGTTTKILKTSSVSPIAQQLGAVLAQQIIENVFPAKVIGIDGNALTISAGNTQFQIGDSVQIYQRGRPLTDPDTGESLGFSETPWSRGVVTQVTSQVSVVTVEQALPVQMPKQVLVARRIDDRELNSSTKVIFPETKGVKNDADW